MPPLDVFTQITTSITLQTRCDIVKLIEKVVHPEDVVTHMSSTVAVLFYSINLVELNC